MVRGALALGLDEQVQPGEVLAVPGWERRQDLQTLALRVYYRRRAAFLRGDEAGVAGGEALSRELRSGRLAEAEAVYAEIESREPDEEEDEEYESWLDELDEIEDLMDEIQDLLEGR